MRHSQGYSHQIIIEINSWLGGCELQREPNTENTLIRNKKSDPLKQECRQLIHYKYYTLLFLSRGLASFTVSEATFTFFHLVILLAHKCFFTRFLVLVLVSEHEAFSLEEQSYLGRDVGGSSVPEWLFHYQ